MTATLDDLKKQIGSLAELVSLEFADTNARIAELQKSVATATPIPGPSPAEPEDPFAIWLSKPLDTWMPPDRPLVEFEPVTFAGFAWHGITPVTLVQVATPEVMRSRRLLVQHLYKADKAGAPSQVYDAGVLYNVEFQALATLVLYGEITEVPPVGRTVKQVVAKFANMSFAESYQRLVPPSKGDAGPSGNVEG